MVALAPVEVLGLLCRSPMLAPAAVLLGVVGSGGLRAAGLAVLRGLGFGFCAGLLCCVCPVRVVLVCVWACPARC